MSFLFVLIQSCLLKKMDFVPVKKNVYSWFNCFMKKLDEISI
ncbi:hypothetical protein C530_109 [Candidatus Portiera aleyrodidarum BT-B-HRs]|nr:hypothetical protein C530_109 [Candidatus Portiera aleyrodidarum BT-B-HRs]